MERPVLYEPSMPPTIPPAETVDAYCHKRQSQSRRHRLRRLLRRRRHATRH